jgi:hypothetical protein
VSKIVACIAIDNGFTKAQTNSVFDEFAQFEKGDKNAFGIVNAITRAGQKFDNDTWFGFDNLAGSLVTMTADSWSNLNKRADALDDETVASAYAVSA